MDPEDLAAAGPGLRVGGIETRDATHYPLSLMAQPGERLLLRLDYDPTRVAPAAAEAVRERLVRLLGSAVAQPDEPLHRLGWLGDAERRAFLEAFNATSRPVPEASLPELFEDQVPPLPRGPGAGLRSGDPQLCRVEPSRQSPGPLADRAGGGPGALVGIALERSAELVVAVLGILKAGAAYLPLDPDYPPGRLAQMWRTPARRRC